MARTKYRAFSGLLIDPLDVVMGDIRLGDIARSNTLNNRYNGHTNFPYSVAQHEILLSIAAPEHALAEKLIHTTYEYRMTAAAALLHDASENIVQDIITPIKRRLRIDDYDFTEVEEGIQKLIFHKYDIPWEFMDIVSRYDARIYEDEAPVLKPFHEPSNLKPLGVLIEEWPNWRETEQKFYQRFNQLELKDGTKH